MSPKRVQMGSTFKTRGHPRIGSAEGRMRMPRRCSEEVLIRVYAELLEDMDQGRVPSLGAWDEGTGGGRGHVHMEAPRADACSLEEMDTPNPLAPVLTQKYG